MIIVLPDEIEINGWVYKRATFRHPWDFLSLFKCPRCKRKMVHSKLLDLQKDCSMLEKVMVCYGCGWFKKEKFKTGCR